MSRESIHKNQLHIYKLTDRDWSNIKGKFFYLPYHSATVSHGEGETHENWFSLERIQSTLMISPSAQGVLGFKHDFVCIRNDSFLCVFAKHHDDKIKCTFEALDKKDPDNYLKSAHPSYKAAFFPMVAWTMSAGKVLFHRKRKRKEEEKKGRGRGRGR